MDQSMEIVDRRVNATGTTEPIIQRQGDDRIILQAPGRSNPEELKRMLGKTAKMTFHLVNEEVEYSDLMAGRVPPGTRIAEETDSRHGGAGKIAIFSRSVLSGDMLVNSSPAFDENGLPAVGFQFNSVGATRFAEITRSNTGKRFAILLDDKVITAPVINTPIMGGSGIITGNFTTQSANELSILLRAGALPAPLKIIEERSVGPGLGNDSIEAGKNASLLGVVLVMLLMLACYGLFGLFANLAMLMNLVIIMAALSLFEATLTLPGIAGMVLTLGMAVDANVLIYERMREETRMGKTPFAAVDSGFRIAFATIVDTHLTTLLAAFVLFYFGTGTVKGFAVTLIIGLIASLFTAVLITRMMIALWMKRYRPKKLPL